MAGCGFPPRINGAHVRTTVAEDGGDYTRAGTVVIYYCNQGNLDFIGGPITCLTSGHWANSDTLRGCSDCRSLYDAGQVDVGAFNVTPNSVNRMEVRCKNGWTIIHRRRYEGVDFRMQSWESYKNGFGARYDDYWIGLENLHILTQTDNEILFTLDLGNNQIYTLQHNKFRVYNESTNYTMTVSKDFTCSRNMTQSFLGFYESNNAAFSTIDKDNDRASFKSCVSYNGPWWYNKRCWTKIRGMNGFFEEMAIVLTDNNINIKLFPVMRAEIRIRRIKD
ncbi:Angiopoietin-related protein 4 [Mizuhopecten yessoensis]|uniref:Angiopoietin-related protein 4 n=1 Tax=Mizuhopecten yessoensis TaxID=6573 RepID=A0A210R317_MIZYE|nr:Angiopoietin-related protein 4 [Mizuhopecten yessoensis]